MAGRFDDGSLLVRTGRLSDYVLGATAETDFLVQLAAGTRDRVAAASSAGIMVATSGRRRYGVGIDSVSAQLEQLQAEVGIGPCVDAIDSGEMVVVEDLAAASPSYGEFLHTALGGGVRSLLSVPLTRASAGASTAPGPGQGENHAARQPAVGALDLYAPVPGAFSAADQELAVELAEEIGSALTLADSYAQKVRLAEQLAQALPSRAVIDQAIGVIIAQQHCSPDEAFAVLRRVSQNGNRKLRDVARDLVERQRRT